MTSKLKIILSTIILMGLGACSTPDPNNTFSNYSPPNEVIIEDHREDSELSYTDITLGDEVSVPQNVSSIKTAKVVDFYISGTGELCWELINKNQELIVMCNNNGNYKFTRSILSQKL